MIAASLCVAGCLVALVLLARRGEAKLERLWGGLFARPSAREALFVRLAAIESARRSVSHLVRGLRAGGQVTKAAKVEAAERALARSTKSELRLLKRVRSVVREGSE